MKTKSQPKQPGPPKTRTEAEPPLRWSQPPPSWEPTPEPIEPAVQSHVIVPKGPVVPMFLSMEDQSQDTDEETAIDLTPFEGQHDQPDTEGSLHNVVIANSSRSGRPRMFDAGDVVYHRGDTVLVERERGVRELATVLKENVRRVERGRMPRVIRKIDPSKDMGKSRLQKREMEVLAIAKHVARSLDMPIKVVKAQAEANGRIAVYFASEDRVDFRELFRRVSAAAQGRVELRQIGVRDAARMLGGIGLCGQPLCCATFLREFAPVSIRMAKDQGLVLNPSRVSGLCGRLLCCLTYEEALYRKQRKLLPRIGKRVVTPLGPGKVRDLDVLHQTIRVALENGEMSTFTLADVKPMFPSEGSHGGGSNSKSRQGSGAQRTRGQGEGRRRGGTGRSGSSQARTEDMKKQSGTDNKPAKPSTKS